MQPYAGWRSACGPYAAPFAVESSVELAVHRAAQGMPYAVALINRARPERCDLDFGRSDRRQVGRQGGDLYGFTGLLLQHWQVSSRSRMNSHERSFTVVVWVTQALDHDVEVQTRQRVSQPGSVAHAVDFSCWPG